MVKRRLFEISAAFSLVLCAGVIALWVRSFFVTEAWGYGTVNDDLTTGRTWIAELCDRTARITVDRHRFSSLQSELDSETSGSFTPGLTHHREDATRWYILRSWWNRMGFVWDEGTFVGASGRAVQSRTSTTIAFPLWLAAGVTALLPCRWGARWWRQRRRLRSGRCPGCGYDLRATPGQCPECGRVNPLSVGTAAVAQ